jgi:uncharacterized protein (DUF1697 family)
MTALQEAFLKAGGRNARTFIQSGNVVFESTPRNVRTVVRKVGEQIRSMLGAEAQILLRTGDEIAEILRVAPFKHLQGDPSVKLSVVFLFANAGKQPKYPLISSKEALEAVSMSEREVFVISRRKANGFYSFPNGFIENQLGVPATSRNWTTVTKIAALLQAPIDG